VYNANNYNGIRLNYSMFSTSARRIAEVIPEMRKKIGGRLGDFLDTTL
jgi:hypothetical protein